MMKAKKMDTLIPDAEFQKEDEQQIEAVGMSKLIDPVKIEQIEKIMQTMET